MREAIESVRVGPVVVHIYQDEDAENIEDMRDSPVWLAHFHRDFWRCSEELPFNDMDSFIEWYKRYAADERFREDEVSVEEMRGRAEEMRAQWVFFIVKAYIHGGVALALEGSAASKSWPDQQFDVSRCGVVLIDKQKWCKHVALDTGDECPKCQNGTVEVVGDEVRCRGECGVVHRYDWQKIAEGHVEEWNQYLSGDVYEIVLDLPGSDEDDEDRRSLCNIYGIEAARAEAQAMAERVATQLNAEEAAFSAFCATLDEEALDGLVHDVKSEEASAINNSGVEEQVRFLLSAGFTKDDLAKDAAEAPSSEHSDAFVARVVRATDEGIKQFGSYTFSDKGPSEVMDIDEFARELGKMRAADAGVILEKIAKCGSDYKRVADDILQQLDGSADDWWEECCLNCPSVEY